MGIKIDELAYARGVGESLIETKYLGKDEQLRGTLGQAYLDIPNNQWKYRPFKEGVKFYNVNAKDLDCANDEGWVRGIYLGKRAIPKEGKAYWSESAEAWFYKPKGDKRLYEVPEMEFKLVRS